jgi:putative copper export protein
VCKFGLTLALHHAFGVDVLGVLLATVTEFIIDILKRRIMKTIKFKNLMGGIVKAIKLIDIKKILGGAWLGEFVRDIHPEIADESRITLN